MASGRGYSARLLATLPPCFHVAQGEAAAPPCELRDGTVDLAAGKKVRMARAQRRALRPLM